LNKQRAYGQQKLDSSTFVGGKISERTGYFHSLRHNIGQTQTLHYQGFDAHMSDDAVHHFRVQSTEYDSDTRGDIGVDLKP
jgi:hypothetical protein